MRRDNQVCFSINYEKVIPEDDEVVTLAEICDEMDFSKLNRKFKNSIRNIDTVS